MRTKKTGPYINRLTRGKMFVAQRKEPCGTHLPRFFRQVPPWTWGMLYGNRTPPFYDKVLLLCVTGSHWPRKSNRASNLFPAPSFPIRGYQMHDPPMRKSRTGNETNSSAGPWSSCPIHPFAPTRGGRKRSRSSISHPPRLLTDGCSRDLAKRED